MYRAFMKMAVRGAEQLRGDSKDPRHIGWIDVKSIRVRTAARGTGGSGVRGPDGRREPPEVFIVKGFDIASSPLFLACAIGKHFESVDIEVFADGGSTATQVYHFVDVVIESMQANNASGGFGPPDEEMSIAFSDWHFEFKTLQGVAAGNAAAGGLRGARQGAKKK